MAELGDFCDDASLRKVLALLVVLRLSNRDLGTGQASLVAKRRGPVIRVGALGMYVAYRTKFIDSYASRNLEEVYLSSMFFLFSY